MAELMAGYPSPSILSPLQYHASLTTRKEASLKSWDGNEQA